MQNPEIVAAFHHGESARRHLFSTPRPLTACIADDPLLTVEALRSWEAALVNHTPPWDLTPHAGFVAARWLLSLVPHARQVTVLVGPGNNGTDGLWMAFELAQRDIATVLYRFGGGANRPAPQMAAWAAALGAGAQECVEPPRGSQVVVDAMLGSGQTRPLASDWIHGMAQAQEDPAAQWWLSLDVPTGLCPRSGQLLGPPPHSHLRRATLNLVTLKPGLFMEHGPRLCGDGWFSGLAASDGSWQLPALPRSMAPELRLNDPKIHRRIASPNTLPRHKGESGSAWVIGGSAGMEGALQLAAHAALHSGPGKTWIVSLSTQGFAGPPECITCPLERAAENKAWGSQDVLAFGCGAGDAPDTRILLNWLASAPRLVLDADGLNRIAASPELQAALRQRAQRGLATILTPHPLEAARLLGVDIQSISRDRLQSARQLADAFQCTVALKGAGTLIASPHEPVVLNPTGSPALAIGGSGDVLAGWLAGRWAQCPLLVDDEARQQQAHAVCALAVWEHGRAAELPPLRHRIPGRELIERLVQLTTPAATNP
jgi:ADP-dependent NAD(P)H-hydrate dehydratase / NAD(P)H-hydrate epimerase